MSASLTHKFVRSLPWAAGEALFNAAYGLGAIFIIGRFITPAELGAATTAISIVLLVEVLSAAGLQEAVVRARSADTLVTDTAFVLAICLSLAGAVLCAGAGLFAAALFEDERLLPLTLAASLALPLNAAGAAPAAVLTRKMRAALLTRRMIGARILGLSVLSLTAALGFGPWSLVLAALGTSAGSLVMVLTAAVRLPRFRFARREANALLHFGALVSAESTLHVISLRAFSLLFGYFHGLAALGNFQLALRLTEEAGALSSGALNRFGLSFFAAKERTVGDTSAAFLAGVQLMTAATAPLFAGIALLAHDFITAIFGARWQDAVPFTEIIAVSWIIVFPRILIGLILRARGEQKVLVAFAASAAAFSLISCLATAAMPALFGAAGFAGRRFFNAPFVTLAVRRYLGIPFKDQIGAAARPLLAVALMSTAVLAFQLLFLDAPLLARLSGSVALGTVVYAAALRALSPETLSLARALVARYKR